MEPLFGKRRTYDEQKVGAGFYSFRTTVSVAGIKYIKLVQADKSPSNTLAALDDVINKRLMPSIGMRNPHKRRGRRKDKAIIQMKSKVA